MVEVWARSVHSGVRGRRSKFFSGASVDKSIYFLGFLHDTISFIRTYLVPGTYFNSSTCREHIFACCFLCDRITTHSSQRYIPTSTCCSMLSGRAYAPHAPRTCCCLLSTLLWCYVIDILLPQSAVISPPFFCFIPIAVYPGMYVQIYFWPFFSNSHRTCRCSLLYQ